jgi:hypothetical protein
VEVEHVVLPRNGKGWKIGDFIFIRKSEKRDVTWLRCYDYSRHSCKASAKIENGAVSLVNDDHTHPPPSNKKLKFPEDVLGECRKPENSRTKLSAIC